MRQVLVVGGVFFGVWLLLGAAGYRSGHLVTLGPAELDPELVRGLAAALAAVIGGALLKLPYREIIRQSLVPLGLASALSAEEQREQLERIRRLDAARSGEGGGSS